MGRRTILGALPAIAGLALPAAGGARPAAKDRNRNNPGPEKRRRPFIEAGDGTNLFHLDWGSGRPVVFLHGMGSNCRQWQYNMVPLADRGLRCIAYDRRGHGRSDDPGTGYTYDVLADDLARVIDQLGLSHAVLVGHSTGAGEIVRYLSRHGAESVAGVVMIGPTLPFILKTADNPDGIDRGALDQLRAAWLKDYPGWIAKNARPFFTPDTSDAQVEWGVNLMMQASLKAIMDCNHAVTETDFRSELTRITVPTLIVHGDQDVSAQIDFTGRRTAKLIPDSKLKVYAGAAHGLFITHAQRFNDDLLDFIAG